MDLDLPLPVSLFAPNLVTSATPGITSSGRILLSFLLYPFLQESLPGDFPRISLPVTHLSLAEDFPSFVIDSFCPSYRTRLLFLFFHPSRKAGTTLDPFKLPFSLQSQAVAAKIVFSFFFTSS